VVGIDTCFESLALASKELVRVSNCYLITMNAVNLAFGEKTFDCVLCIQNGIAVFGVDKKTLLQEAIRVTRIYGTILFSSYSENFWEDRLAWFQMQSDNGLIGAIDREMTGNGVIVCKDGFRATTVDRGQFIALIKGLNVESEITEVDGSSIFCKMVRLPD